MHKYKWMLMGLILCILGCPGSKITEVDSANLFQDIQFNYHQGQNLLYFSVRVEPTYLGKQLQAVNALYYGFDSTQTADTLVLNDSGLSGDILSDDDVYSIKVPNDTNNVRYVLEPADTGLIYIRYISQYGSEIKERMAGFKMGNQGPRIISVSMPDTLRRPPADSITVGTIVVTVDDLDGYEDVQSCYLMFKKPDGTFSSGSPISLYDDGNKDFSMYLWDEIANDGKFSRYIIIDSNNPLGKYTSYFYARDYSGILSEPFVTTLIVIP